ncbi:MAG: PAS domain-containing protein [Leptolyngbyaceae cyanobacterium RM2_2_4]|nr:PAS domain-containing protein [Leptolyngbyaceae cyanobacterium SM1_4_3]NJN90628.1 PAS domain-containing protein [Leptolyngbyaceae cyanobacterium SL_5_14]NJO50028.1 PAS domain-containing protein [Leptolyngbyaceae cyanobacterium RM2_2_4]
MSLTSNQQTQSEEISVLKVLSSLSYQAGELDIYLNAIAQGVSQLINTDWSIVTVCDAGEGKVLGSSINLPEDETLTFATHGTILDNVLETGQPFVVEDTTLHPEYGEMEPGYCAYLGIPLRTSSGDVLGTICSFQRQPRRFTPEEIRLVEIFSERAATAVDNYQLYQQQQRFNETLEAAVVQRTVQLRAAQAKLMELNSQLEQKVERRTAELQQINTQLQSEIFQHQQTEAALRISEEQLRQIAENMRQVLWMYSLDGQPIYISSAFEAIWQRSRQDWLTDRTLWHSSIHPDDQERMLAAFQQAASTGYREEYRIIRPNGSVRLIHDQAFPILDVSGKVYRLAGIAEDITERRQTEQEKMQAIASLAEVGELAAMIVHEIRNPLTTIWMGLSAFQRLKLSAPFQERLRLSIEEGERIKNLLSEILLYAKPHLIQQEAIELNLLLRELTHSSQALPFAKNRFLKFQPLAEPVYVWGDRNKLRQVLINLINNACDAISEGETVTLRLQPSHQSVCVQVHNSGEPIPPDHLPNLTKPFYTTKASGTGLGLAIVKRIVEAHQGQLVITSSATEGTLASVHLSTVPEPDGDD